MDISVVRAVDIWSMKGAWVLSALITKGVTVTAVVTLAASNIAITIDNIVAPADAADRHD